MIPELVLGGWLGAAALIAVVYFIEKTGTRTGVRALIHPDLEALTWGRKLRISGNSSRLATARPSPEGSDGLGKA